MKSCLSYVGSRSMLHIKINTSSDESLAIWHKSHIVYQKTFIVKAAVDEALFELTWVDFQDEKDKQELLYFANGSLQRFQPRLTTIVSR